MEFKYDSNNKPPIKNKEEEKPVGSTISDAFLGKPIKSVLVNLGNPVQFLRDVSVEIRKSKTKFWSFLILAVLAVVEASFLIMLMFVNSNIQEKINQYVEVNTQSGFYKLTPYFSSKHNINDFRVYYVLKQALNWSDTYDVDPYMVVAIYDVMFQFEPFQIRTLNLNVSNLNYSQFFTSIQYLAYYYKQMLMLSKSQEFALSVVLLNFYNQDHTKALYDEITNTYEKIKAIGGVINK